MRCISQLSALILLLFTNLTVFAAGPDVVVYRLELPRQVGATDANGFVGVTTGTDSCNLGDQILEWKAPPNDQHPVISVNLYRLSNNRMQQLGMSWVKHGFFATNESHCAGMPGVPATCSAPTLYRGNKLYPGCTDLYPTSLNSNEGWLGPRSKINPVTGKFDGPTARDLTGYPSGTSLIQKIVYVDRDELLIPDARYFIEGHYVAADDAKAGNAKNNITYYEVEPTLQGGQFILNQKSGSPTNYYMAAVSEWKNHGAHVELIETQEELNAISYVYVMSNAIELSDGRYRYEYAVYNMNSDRAVGGFSVPLTGTNKGFGFYAPKYQGEIYSDKDWVHTADSQKVDWKTSENYQQNNNANAIRWGTAYNFWFVSSVAPALKPASLTWFKPGNSASTVSVNAIAPKN